MEAKQRLKKGELAVGKISSRDEAVLSDGGSRCESVLYDFTVDTGATGTYNFGRKLPAGAIVTNVFSDEQTALTSGGSATVQLRAGTTALTDALAFDTDFTGTEEQDLASSATAIKVAAESELNAVVAGAALTAGKVRFYVRYVLQNDQK